MEQEKADAQPEKTDAEPVKMRSCALEAGAEGVRFIVDGQVAKILPFDTYEAFHKNFTRGLEFNIYPLETADHTELKLQLPPLSEIRAGRIELRSLDGVTYGRQYKLIEVKKEADGRSYAIVALADTGEVVEREPWKDFKRRVAFRRCRSGTAYDTMLGELSPRLYFDVTGKIYKPDEEQPGVKETEAAQKKPAREAVKKPLEKEPEKADPLLKIATAGIAWLRKNPRYGYIAAAVLLLALIFTLVRVRRGPNINILKPKSEVQSPVNLDYHLNQEYQIAQAFSRVDFVKYARSNPQAARDSVANLAGFVERNRSTPNLTAEQAQKLLFISSTVKQLEAALVQATAK
ncbi:MAG: hypothetical protein ACLQVA_06065 [Candidatus Brocadiia bacterium]